MPTLLRIDSSVSGAASRTRLLTGALAEAWLSRGKEFRVVTRDLHEHPLPQLRTAAQHWPEPMRGGEPLDEETDAVQRAVLDELIDADAVVLGVPMYNSSMPSTLKSWLDMVHVPGVTAPLGEGPQPLLGCPLVIATAQGGPVEADTADYLTGPLRYILGGACGMEVHVVSTSCTLAGFLPGLDVAFADGELSRALDRARELGASLPAA